MPLKRIRYALGSLVLATAGLAATIQPAAASLGVPGIEIEAKSPYCGQDASPNCQTTTSAADIDYALVNVYSFAPRVQPNGEAIGTPDFLNVVCAHGLEAARATVLPGRRGTISGHVKVGKNPTETNTHALGEVELWAINDSAIVYVEGAQITDNGPDTLLAGGFNVTITGPIVNLATGATRFGTMSCTTRKPVLTQEIVLDPTAPPPDNLVAPPYFESVFNTGPDTDPS